MSDRILADSSCDEDISEESVDEAEEDYSDNFEQSDNDTGHHDHGTPKDVKSKRPKMEPLYLRKTGKKVSSGRASRVSSGSGSVSTSRMNGLIGTNRSDSLSSSLSASFQKRHSSLQARVNSAKKKSQTDLINTIGALKIQVQDLESEKRHLGRLVARQERELDKFVNAEADLPVILRAHNEETRVLKMKIRQAQESNRKLTKDIKSKDSQLLFFKEENKELKKINSCDKLDEVYSLKCKLEEVSQHLQSRDEEYRESLKRQDILERSHKQQLATDNRKLRGARQQLKTSEERAAKLEVELKEKNRLLSRLHIYSWRKTKDHRKYLSEEHLNTSMRMSDSVSVILVDKECQQEDFSRDDKITQEVGCNTENLNIDPQEYQDDINEDFESSIPIDSRHTEEDLKEESNVTLDDANQTDLHSIQSSVSAAAATVPHTDTLETQASNDLNHNISTKSQESSSSLKEMKENNVDDGSKIIKAVINDYQKAALIAKLNEIDTYTKTDDSLTLKSDVVDSLIPTNNNNVERKSNLMLELFGGGAQPPAKPLKTSMKTSSSNYTKSVKFYEEESCNDH